MNISLLTFTGLNDDLLSEIVKPAMDKDRSDAVLVPCTESTNCASVDTHRNCGENLKQFLLHEYRNARGVSRESIYIYV